MGKYFGTDGFRGKVGVDLTAEHAYHIGRFLGERSSKAKGEQRARVLVGKDTRASGAMLECALVAGLCACGVDVYLLGVFTTPGVSYVVERGKFDAGVMISASHNLYYDNGIKLFSENGEKMDDATVALLEEYLDTCENLSGNATFSYATERGVGNVYECREGREWYIEHLISVPRVSFRGFKIGLDCANGSAYQLALAVFQKLGADVSAMGVTPDGFNINEKVGSTHIDTLAQRVKEEHLDFGFAFDGDGDRCLAVDAKGMVITGDHILYLLARRMQQEGRLYQNTVVTTVMSNLGLEKALFDRGISCVSTQVGDRFVWEKMQECTYSLGGETSGHIILSDFAKTGDGILTALYVTETLVSTGKTLSEFRSLLPLYPQLTKNIRIPDNTHYEESQSMKNTIEKIRQRFGAGGRILVRKSGTEPVIRILVEASDEDVCERAIDEVVCAIEREGFCADV